ncbi:hypothetical protein ABID21_000489 [Pseudorhizobium tarimense]|uniref:Uncharacterized protein n=1 Tax=Pseudorhizobium tarimense TaxID=1079109 RepID=A0ABV2H1S1_9HYPH|nr:hypothetical protein [Pseudorhizobium tarimense]MCJ8517980.1 hypothetical protein [Pseudorhizobium tarimense]
MLLLTATLLGMSAAFLRSALSIALVALLIVAAFAGAGLVSGGTCAFTKLVYALLGYNLGLFNVLCGLLLARRLRLI